MTETEAIRENYNLGVLAGEAREQQRIIKLLEEAAPKSWHDTPDQQRMFGWLDAIALIKGENK